MRKKKEKTIKKTRKELRSEEIKKMTEQIIKKYGDVFKRLSRE